MNSSGWDLDYMKNRAMYDAVFNSVMRMKPDGGVDFLEHKIGEVIGRKHVVAVGSGTDALMFALMVNDIKPNDRVLVSNFSWIASASVVNMVGAMPVFCDIDLDSYHMSLDSIKRMHKKHGADAIIYPQLFGNTTIPMDIIQYCEENNIIFIEDSCQAIGSSSSGIKAGTMGDCSTLSFNHNKNIAGIAGGGAFMCDDAWMASEVMYLRSQGHGMRIGYNSTMLVPNAHFIDTRLRRLGEYTKARRKNALMYNTMLEGLPIWTQENQADGHSYHKYVIRFRTEKERDDIQKLLSASIHYDKTIAGNPAYVDTQYAADSCSNAKTAAKTVLTLPLNHMTTRAEIAGVVHTLWKYYESET